MDEELLQQLIDVLTELYGENASIRRIVHDAGINLESIDLSSYSVPEAWRFILEEGTKTGSIDMLLRVVKREYGEYPKFKIVYETYQVYRHPPTMSARHVSAATPILVLLVFGLGILCVVVIAGGIGGLLWGDSTSTRFGILGLQITTVHVGIVLIALGAIAVVFIVRVVLSNLYKLAALPDDQTTDTIINTGGGTYVAGNAIAGRDFTGRDKSEERSNAEN